MAGGCEVRPNEMAKWDYAMTFSKEPNKLNFTTEERFYCSCCGQWYDKKALAVKFRYQALSGGSYIILCLLCLQRLRLLKGAADA